MAASPSVYPTLYPVSHLFPISLSVKCFDCYMGCYKCLALWLHMFSDSWAAMSLCIHSCSLSEEVSLIKSGRIFKLFENYIFTSTLKHLSIIFSWIERVFLYKIFSKAFNESHVVFSVLNTFSNSIFNNPFSYVPMRLMEIKTLRSALFPRAPFKTLERTSNYTLAIWRSKTLYTLLDKSTNFFSCKEMQNHMLFVVLKFYTVWGHIWFWYGK